MAQDTKHQELRLEKAASSSDDSLKQVRTAEMQNELDAIPDPDAGKTDAERAALDKKLMRKVDL
jgi:hypothetical protein